jgi:hypothetical protein
MTFPFQTPASRGREATGGARRLEDYKIGDLFSEETEELSLFGPATGLRFNPSMPCCPCRSEQLEPYVSLRSHSRIFVKAFCDLRRSGSSGSDATSSLISFSISS